ncbi:cytochrome b [Pseudooceanicola sp. HF7]|uniref:cytochrome b n=1 Tax=Pseudooceanicola sp. HF7 TaxID=2721560 RepID=UPI00142FB8ED|nr:cytochrome b/b6 domain-containing protein [Pseudooceanicola sp. HF7]NIZ08565.1 cytochrome b [Pseudooceanicola sp. HF7]
MTRIPPAIYSKPQIYLHWAIALLVLFQLIFDMGMGRAFHQMMEGTATGPGLAIVHIVVGVTVLVLMIARLGLRLTRGAPPLPQEEPGPLKALAGIVHWVFYALLVLIPLSGLAAWFGQVAPAAGAHEVLTTLLWAVIALHVAGALYQQFVLKTGLLRRMSPH